VLPWGLSSNSRRLSQRSATKYLCKSPRTVKHSGDIKEWKAPTIVTDMLQHADLRSVLSRFIVAIERDQLRIDAIPRTRLHPEYDDTMWRDWRNGHRIYLNRLVSTVADMPPSLLETLSAIARSYNAEPVRAVILEIFSEVISGSCDPDEIATASRFFGHLIEQVKKRAKATARGQRANVSLARWFPVSDPLRIAADPEVNYGPSVSLALLVAEVARSTDA
jgi:hypothetical protein